MGFTIALIAAIRGDPAATRRGLADVDYDDAPSWAWFLAFGCAVFEGWSATLLGDVTGRDRIVAALDHLECHVPTQMLRPVFRTFLGQAMMHLGDPAALEILEQARAETYARGELWWLAETLRLLALAEQRFGDPAKSVALFDEALRLAQAQAARLLVDRVAASA